jgi:hypothetical protein
MAAEAIELDKDAFMRLVTQNHLQVEGPSAGYLYTGKQGKNGWELYKTANNPWYLYQARRVNTSGGAGALIVRIQVPAGICAKLISSEVLGPASAGATLTVNAVDEDAATACELYYVSAGANRRCTLPCVGNYASTGSNLAESIFFLIGPGEYLYYNGSTSLLNETLTVAVKLLLSAKVEPVWDIIGSVAGSALGDSSISAANTWQLVAMP